MTETDIDQWINLGKSAYEIYRFRCFLPPIPTTVARNGLTFAKSRDKYRQEQRLLPEECYGVFDDKSSGPVYLNPPVEIGEQCQAYFKSGSSQHMFTILEGISEIGVKFKDIQFLVASETLHTIAGSVFKQSKSWRLRAYLEIIEGEKVIVVCNDDLNEVELLPFRDTRFVKEHTESINFAQSLCERNKGRNTNRFLHGNRVAVSSLTHRNSTVNMLVVGEMDMAADEGHPLNVAVMTGRPNRVCLGDSEENICDSFEYLWSRCFWIGITTCIIGMRSTPKEPVKAIHRFDIRDYAQKHRGRVGEHHDTATTCVAQVMVLLRDVFQSRPDINWIIEYEGRPEDMEPSMIKIRAADDSYSLWQVCEECYIAKSYYKKRAMKMERDNKAAARVLKTKVTSQQTEQHTSGVELQMEKNLIETKENLKELLHLKKPTGTKRGPYKKKTKISEKERIPKHATKTPNLCSIVMKTQPIKPVV